MKTPNTKELMTNIVLVWRFLLNISVSVTRKIDQSQKAFRGMILS